jgi:hypothetical protein
VWRAGGRGGGGGCPRLSAFVGLRDLAAARGTGCGGRSRPRRGERRGPEGIRAAGSCGRSMTRGARRERVRGERAAGCDAKQGGACRGVAVEDEGWGDWPSSGRSRAANRDAGRAQKARFKRAMEGRHDEHRPPRGRHHVEHVACAAWPASRPTPASVATEGAVGQPGQPGRAAGEGSGEGGAGRAGPGLRGPEVAGRGGCRLRVEAAPPKLNYRLRWAGRRSVI